VLVGENWTKKSDWRSTRSMCVWYGIVCIPDNANRLVKELRLSANNLTGNIDNITVLGNLRYLERLDLDSNSITGNLTAFCRTLVSFPNLTHVDLRLNELTGSVPTEVCESIGNGILRVDCGIECDCCNHDELCKEECVDVPGWHDIFHDECAWYGEDDDNCEDYGSCCGNDGHTANTACCACGGGIKVQLNPSPSPAPSLSQDPTVSVRPTQSPSLSQKPTVSMQPTNQYEQQMGALVAVYGAANGNAWHSNTNWLSDAQVCNWFGVSCNNNGDMIGLDLYDNSLSGSLPSELGLLTDLQILRLASNALSGSLPSELGLLTDLQVLRFNHNTLSGNLPSELGLFENLQRLYLDSNSLVGSIPSELELLTSLQVLHFYDNSLIGTAYRMKCARCVIAI